MHVHNNRFLLPAKDISFRKTKIWRDFIALHVTMDYKEKTLEDPPYED